MNNQLGIKQIFYAQIDKIWRDFSYSAAVSGNEQRIEKGKERNSRNEEMGNMIVLLKPILRLERWFQIKVFEEQLLI